MLYKYERGYQVSSGSRVGITKGGAGYFVVQYDSKTYEPYFTGTLYYATPGQALREALTWSVSEEAPIDESVVDALDEWSACL